MWSKWPKSSKLVGLRIGLWWTNRVCRKQCFWYQHCQLRCKEWRRWGIVPLHWRYAMSWAMLSPMDTLSAKSQGSVVERSEVIVWRRAGRDRGIWWSRRKWCVVGGSRLVGPKLLREGGSFSGRWRRYSSGLKRAWLGRRESREALLQLWAGRALLDLQRIYLQFWEI